jgi:uncharacterized membrane protein
MRNRGSLLVFALPTLIALWFIYGFVFSYLGGEPGRFGIYAPRRQWLTMHILAGSVAILLGPLQFWLGLNRRTATLHRVLGVFYVVAVGISGSAAFYLGFHTDFGWVFGTGMIGMGCAWIMTTSLATISICRRMVEQHREWMIRSYVVTFGFVTFRVLTMVFEMLRAGTLVERMAAASWFAWSVPLLITETILQGRKIFAMRATAASIPDANAYSVSPEPEAFDLHNSGSSYLHRP